MKLHLMQNDNIIHTYDIPIFGEESDSEKTLKKLRNIWRDACNFRDNVDGVVRLNFRGEVDAAGKEAIAVGMNIGQFAKILSYYVNAYLPKTEGAAAVKSIFAEEPGLSLDTTLDWIQHTGEVKNFAMGKYGVFNFHFYPPMEWAKYSMTTIAGAASFMPFEIQDYSVICNAITKCPKGARPMVWLNPTIIQAFCETAECDIDYAKMQAYVSSFVIIAALENDGTIDDAMVTQLWESLRNFCEDDCSIEMLQGLYDSAETLLHTVLK